MTLEPKPPQPTARGTPGQVHPHARSMTSSASGDCARPGDVPPSVANTGVLVGPDQQRRFEPVKPGQITDVDQVRYQHCVQVAAAIRAAGGPGVGNRHSP